MDAGIKFLVGHRTAGGCDCDPRAILPIDFGDEGEIERLTHLGSGNVAVGAWTPSGRLTLVVRLIEG
ncbi:hypothetical protein A5722_13975 [Mycobacterium vulneris]|nr:hypothetical protein A5722_13975 [Mycolicibacterium vulneris]OCB67476.1 hypothetical protein A5729_01165 [Mycolicibacterium vulneris]